MIMKWSDTMLPTIIIGIVFLAYFLWAFNSSRKSIRSNKCAGCSGGCSTVEKEKCSTNH